MNLILNRFTQYITTTFTNAYAAFKRLNRTLVTSVLICITVIVLGFLIYRQWDVIISYRWQFRPIPILLSFIFFSIALFWVALVWGWIVNHLGSKITYRKHIQYYIISNLTKRIPGTIWYIASRAQFYLSEGLDIKTTTVASGIEMVMSTMAGILVVLVFSYRTLLRYRINPIILVIIFCAGLAIIHPKIIKWFLRHRNLESDTLQYRFIIQGIFCYILVWILDGILLFEIGNIIYPITSENIPYLISCWALVGIISTVLFFSPSNFGITEIGLSLLLSNVVPSSIAVLIAVSSRILITIFELVWASLYFLLSPTPKNLLTRKD